MGGGLVRELPAAGLFASSRPERKVLQYLPHYLVPNWGITVTEHMYDEDDVTGAGSVKELAGALGCLQVAPVAGDIEELLALRDRLDSKLSGALHVFEAEQGWAEDGSLSLTAWLAAHGRRSRKDAHREAVTAKRLSALPVTAAAWADGVLSSSQVGAVVANVSAEHASLYGAHEEELTPVLASLSVRDTAAAMRSWRLHAEATSGWRRGAFASLGVPSL